MMNHARLSAIIATIFLLGLAGKIAYAHPADMFFQSNHLSVTPTQIHLSWSIGPGSLIATLLWDDADLDHDGLVSPAEAQTWAEPILAQFSANLDDLPLPWQLEAVDWPTSLVNFQVGDETIILHGTADLPAQLTGAAHLNLHNHYQESISINRFEVQADAGLMFHPPQQVNGALQLDIERPEKNARPDSTLIAAWNSGIPSLEAAAADSMGLTGLTAKASGVEQPHDPRASAKLTSLIRSENLSPSFLLLAFVIAAVLGSLHALTPGHGKTVVAAYLIGTRGTTRHAISLGAIVTLTHTGSVFALGLVALAASQYILPTSLFPILELASGLLIVGLGAYLLYERWLAHRANLHHRQHHHDHDHDHDHHHDHDHDHHHHDHDHDHDHDHHIPDRITWRSLLALGISGGLVPCPDAIAILLVAIAVNRITFGLSLIVAFSLGLAVVLIVIGLLLVHSRRLFEKMEAFNRAAPVMPMVSAAIVLLLGLVLTFNAIRGTEMRALAENNGASPATVEQLPAASATGTESTDLAEARILYLLRDERSHPQLVVRRLSQAEPEPLTQQPGGIRRYEASPDGSKVIYSIGRDDGGAELWLVTLADRQQRQLLVCPDVTCDDVTWSADGQRAVYDKLEVASPGNPLGLPSLWSLEVDSGVTQPVFPNSQWPGFNPSWSPDGQWLGYTSPGSRKIELINLKDGRRQTLSNQLGSKVAWHPAGTSVVIDDVLTQADGLFIHVFRFDLDTGKLVDLSQAANAEDSSPAWSPDGQWIALIRRTLSGPNASKDLQIWVMRPDGSEARPLTHQSGVYYSLPAWSPDSKYLIFHQTEANSSQGSEIWVINLDTGESQSIGAGQWPHWLPG